VAESDSIMRELYIDAPPETVFAFFVDPDKLLQWKGMRCELDPRPGGVFRLEIDEANIVRGEYIAVESPRRLVLTWGWESGPPLPPGASMVTVVLTAQANGTLLRLVHTGLPPPFVVAHTTGWDHYLPRLVAAAESASG